MKKNQKNELMNAPVNAPVEAVETSVEAVITKTANNSTQDDKKNTEAPKKAPSANDKARAAAAKYGPTAPMGLTVRQYTDADVVRDSDGNAAARVSRIDLVKNLYACTDSRRSYADHIVTAKSRLQVCEPSNRYDVFEIIYGRDCRIACNDILRQVIVTVAKKQNLAIIEKYFRKFDLKWQIVVDEKDLDTYIATIYAAFEKLAEIQTARAK